MSVFPLRQRPGSSSRKPRTPRTCQQCSEIPLHPFRADTSHLGAQPRGSGTGSGFNLQHDKNLTSSRLVPQNFLNLRSERQQCRTVVVQHSLCCQHFIDISAPGSTTFSSSCKVLGIVAFWIPGRLVHHAIEKFWVCSRFQQTPQKSEVDRNVRSVTFHTFKLDALLRKDDFDRSTAS